MGLGWKNSKKTIGRSPGYHSYTKQDMKRVCWCHKKEIIIGVSPNWETTSEWKVELNIKKNIHLDPASYQAAEAHKKMYEYYKYYYNKYKLNTNKNG